MKMWNMSFQNECVDIWGGEMAQTVLDNPDADEGERLRRHRAQTSV